MCNLEENLLFFTLILGSVFSDYVVFYGDLYFILGIPVSKPPLMMLTAFVPPPTMSRIRFDGMPWDELTSGNRFKPLASVFSMSSFSHDTCQHGGCSGTCMTLINDRLWHQWSGILSLLKTTYPQLKINLGKLMLNLGFFLRFFFCKSGPGFLFLSTKRLMTEWLCSTYVIPMPAQTDDNRE